MGQSFEERDDRGKGKDVGGKGTRAKRSDVDVATVGYNQNILESVNRTDGKATCEVGGVMTGIHYIQPGTRPDGLLAQARYESTVHRPKTRDGTIIEKILEIRETDVVLV